MKRFDLFRHVLPMIGVVLLGACTRTEVPVTAPSPSVSVTQPAIHATEQAPAPTSAIRPTSTSLNSAAGSTPTQTPVDLSITIAPNNWSLPDDFLFNDPQSGCELPCWRELRIGVSGNEEIQTTINHVFGWTDERDLLSDDYTSEASNLVDNPDLAVGRFGETIFELPRQSFAIEVWFDQRTRVLQGLGFLSAYDSLDSFLVPRHVIDEIGKPSYLFASLFPEPRLDNIASAVLMLVYEQGVVVLDIIWVPLDETTSTIRLCFDYPDNYTQGILIEEDGVVVHRINQATVYLMEPFDGLENLDPLQAYFITHQLEQYGLKAFDEVFGISTTDLIERLVQQDDVCLSTTVSQ